MKLHVGEKGTRVLGKAESFKKTSIYSTLVGIVMHLDLVIDGMIFGNATIKGNDATKNIFSSGFEKFFYRIFDMI